MPGPYVANRLLPVTIKLEVTREEQTFKIATIFAFVLVVKAPEARAKTFWGVDAALGKKCHQDVACHLVKKHIDESEMLGSEFCSFIRGVDEPTYMLIHISR